MATTCSYAGHVQGLDHSKLERDKQIYYHLTQIVSNKAVMEHMAVFLSSDMAISTLREDFLQILITFVQMMTG